MKTKIERTAADLAQAKNFFASTTGKTLLAASVASDTDRFGRPKTPIETLRANRDKARKRFDKVFGRPASDSPNITTRQTRHTISPYPPYIVVEGDKVFSHGKYRGYVDKINNWGTDFLARCEDGKPNQFFATKTEAVFYLAK